MFLTVYTEYVSGRRGFLSDEAFYALAGWRYVHGSSLDIMTLSHPPLAIYLIGLSELLFMNHVMLSLVVSFLTLIIVYLISKSVVPHSPIALIPVFLLSLDKMYTTLSSVAWLEIYATLFASLSVLLLLSQRRWAKPLLYVSMGLALSCKWSTVFLVALPVIYYALKKDWNQLKSYPLFLIITLITYSSTYAIFFIQGHTLQDFITLQSNMFAGQRYERFTSGTPPPFWLLLNFLTGIEGPTVIQEVFANVDTRTITVIATGTGISLIPFYNPFTWPMLFSSSFLALYYSKNESREVVPLASGLLLFLAIFSTGQHFIWYMLPVFPLAFGSLGYTIHRIYSESKNKKRAIVILVLYLASAAVCSLFVQMPPYIWISRNT
jgi:dolichyl-phosphate-mannose--protein O-mannosyl transferase